MHTHGVIEDLPITVNGVTTTMNFYVVDIEDTGKNHPTILGRPWLRRSDAVSYWKTRHMSFGSSKEKIPVQPREDPSVEEESSSSLSSLSPSPSSDSIEDTDGGELFKINCLFSYKTFL